MSWLGLSLLLAVSAADATVEAKELARQGQQAFKEGKYREAAARFEAALSLRPRPGLQFNLARCWEALGESAKAARAYREYLRLAPDAADRPAVLASVAALDAQLAKAGLTPVVIRLRPDTALGALDGAAPRPGPLYAEVSAGAHVLVAEGPGLERLERRVVAEGRLVELEVEVPALRPAAPPSSASPAPPVVVPPPTPALSPPPPPPLTVAQVPPPLVKRRVGTWVSLGVSSAAAIAAVVLGVAAQGASTELRSGLHTRAQGDELVAGVRTLSTAANVSWIGAGVGLIATVILFFVEGLP